MPKLGEETSQKICQEILRLLGQKSRLSISEIAKLVGVNRSTAAKYLHVLKAQGLSDYEQIGPVKLWSISEIRGGGASA